MYNRYSYNDERSSCLIEPFNMLKKHPIKIIKYCLPLGASAKVNKISKMIEKDVGEDIVKIIDKALVKISPKSKPLPKYAQICEKYI